MKLRGALGEANDKALGRLKLALIAQPGFQLIFLEVPEGSIREQVLEQILAWGGKDEIPRLERLRARGRTEIVPMLTSKDGGIVLDAIDSSLLDDDVVDRFVGALNWQRDQLRKRIAGPLILAVSARGIARLFERAPDLATWRSHTCRIRRFLGGVPVETFLERILSSDEPDPIELAHAEAVLRRLADRRAPPDEVARVWTRIGICHETYGDLGQARKAFEKAGAMAAAGGDAQLQAYSHLFCLDVQEDLLEAAERRLSALEPHLMAGGDSASDASWLLLAAGLAAAKGAEDESLALAKRALAAVSDRPELQDRARFALAAALFSAGKIEEVSPLLEELMHAGDTELAAKSYLLAAQIERARDRSDLAIKLLRKGIALTREDAGLRQQRILMVVELSGLLVTIGEWSEARTLLTKRAKELQHASAAVRAAAALTDGVAALELGSAEALTLLEKAAGLSRGSLQEPGALLTLAVARSLASEREEARRDARKGEQLARAWGLQALLDWFQPFHELLFSDGPMPDSEDAGHREERKQKKKPDKRAMVRGSKRPG